MKTDSLKIISGGQTGADLAGLWAAKAFNIPTGGYAPAGFRTLLGPKPTLGTFFGLVEHASQSYQPRTLENVRSSDLTLIFASNFNSPGTKLTIGNCKRENVQYILVPHDPSTGISYDHTIFQSVTATIQRELLVDRGIVINIAGNATQNSKMIFEFTFCFLVDVFSAVTGVPAGSPREASEILKDVYEPEPVGFSYDH